MTLYLKYRPKNLDELDLPEVSESLKKITSSSQIPHAFLFAGPKGTGKTSAARILAKIINCESPLVISSKSSVPCDKCNQCLSITKGNNLDVIEMDAASHRGIDDVRFLRDAVKLAPSAARKKIYIIDEAHMLTTEASNALLKTLEEPPDHVIFILATTNPEKLIDTIRSRTTLISFRKAKENEIIKALKKVAQSEKINLSDDSFKKIADLSGGAFRDAIKILEQVNVEGEEYLSKFKNAELDNFIKFLIDKNAKAAIDEIENSIQKGTSVDTYLNDLLTLFHEAILSEIGVGEAKIKGLDKKDLIILIDLFTLASKDTKDSPIEQLPLEIAVIKWCDNKDKSDEEKVMSREQDDKKQKEKPQEEHRDVENQPNDSNLSDSSNVSNTADLKVDDGIWQKILQEIHPVNISIEGLLRSSKPINYDGKTLTLGVYYKFHKERLEDIHHKKIIENALEKVLNSPTRVNCMLVDPSPKKIIEEVEVKTVLTEAKEPDIVRAAEEIFGN